MLLSYFILNQSAWQAVLAFRFLATALTRTPGTRSRPKLNYRAARDFDLGRNSEPSGNDRSFLETRERAYEQVKIRSRDSIYHLVNSTYFFKVTNYNQHAFNIKYLANLIKKYWTCLRYQNLADFVVCFRPSAGLVAAISENLLEDTTRLNEGSSSTCQLNFVFFYAVQSRPSTTFPKSWHDYWKQYFRSYGRQICLPDSPNWR